MTVGRQRNYKLQVCVCVCVCVCVRSRHKVKTVPARPFTSIAGQKDGKLLITEAHKQLLCTDCFSCSDVSQSSCFSSYQLQVPRLNSMNHFKGTRQNTVEGVLAKWRCVGMNSDGLEHC